jgi:hypothetical protein
LIQETRLLLLVPAGIIFVIEAWKVLKMINMKIFPPNQERYSPPFFFIWDCEAIGTAAIPGLLCQPRVIMKMIVEK